MVSRTNALKNTQKCPKIIQESPQNLNYVDNKYHESLLLRPGVYQKKL